MIMEFIHCLMELERTITWFLDLIGSRLNWKKNLKWNCNSTENEVYTWNWDRELKIYKVVNAFWNAKSFGLIPSFARIENSYPNKTVKLKCLPFLLQIIHLRSEIDLPMIGYWRKLALLLHCCIIALWSLLHYGHKWNYLIIRLLHTGYLICDNLKKFCA